MTARGHARLELFAEVEHELHLALDGAERGDFRFAEVGEDVEAAGGGGEPRLELGRVALKPLHVVDQLLQSTAVHMHLHMHVLVHMHSHINTTVRT